LLSGFYLLRVFDVTVATLVAAAINIAVALIGLWLSRVTYYDAPVTEIGPRSFRVPAGAWPVYITIGLSGMTALGAEVIWTRILSLLFGATVYTFSLILGAFLLGLGIGSSIGAGMARTVGNPRTALGLCQLLLMAGIAWAGYSLTEAQTSCARSGRCCRPRCSGAPASRWRLPRWPPPSRTPGIWLAASTPPTPWVPSSARWPPRW
jgi:spermidine synthase